MSSNDGTPTTETWTIAVRPAALAGQALQVLAQGVYVDGRQWTPASHTSASNPHDQYLTQEEAEDLFAPIAGGGYLTQDAADLRYEQLSRKGQPNGYAPLDANRLIPTVHLPPLAITNTYVAASQGAMLALTAQTGDVCVRTDTSQTYILAAEPASVLANWVLLATPTDAVTSVNGETGAVVLTAADLGALDQATADGRFVNVGGDTMTGALTVGGVVTVANSYLDVNSGLNWLLFTQAPGLESRIGFRTDSGLHRWNIVKRGSAEAGGNAGSDLGIWRHDDAGALLGTALAISRATGESTFGGSIQVLGGAQVWGNLYDYGGTFVVAASTGAHIRLSAATGTARLVQAETGGVPRWLLRLADETLEGGANAGSDFSLTRYSDSGLNLGAALRIKRDTGAATFGGTASATSLRVRDPAVAEASAGTYEWAYLTGADLFKLRYGAPAGGFTDTGIQAYANGAFWATTVTVNGFPVAISPDPGQTLEWRANGLYSSASGTGGGGTDTTVLVRQAFVPAPAATTVTLAQAPVAVLQVARNGVVQNPDEGHYTLAGAVLTFQAAFDGTEDVQVLSQTGVARSTGNTTVLAREEFAPAAAATSVALAQVATALLEVTRNGVVQSQTAGDYALAGATVTFSDAFVAGERVSVLYSVGTSVVADAYTRAQADARFVDVAGDGMSGALSVNAEVASQGAAGQLRFADRAGGQGYLWFASNGVAYLYDAGLGKTRATVGPTGTLSLAQDAGQTALQVTGGALSINPAANGYGVTVQGSGGGTTNIGLQLNSPDNNYAMRFRGEAGGSVGLEGLLGGCYLAPVVAYDRSIDLGVYPNRIFRSVYTAQVSAGPNPLVLGTGSSLQLSFGGYGHPLTDNSMYWGHPSYRWAAMYSAGGVITTSHADFEEDVAPLDPAACAQAVLDTDWLSFAYAAPPLVPNLPGEPPDQAVARASTHVRVAQETAPARRQNGYVLGSAAHRTSPLFGLSDRKSASPGSDLAIVACALQQALRELAELRALVEGTR